MMKGIIFSLVKTYFHQNSHTHDYLLMCKKLFQRHVNRGWDRSRLVAYLHDTYGTRNLVDKGPPLILLMDWDRTGGGYRQY